MTCQVFLKIIGNPARRCEKIALTSGGRAGVLEKLYSDSFSRVDAESQKPCNVAYLTWPMTLTSK